MKLISRSHWAPDAPSTFPCFLSPRDSRPLDGVSPPRLQSAPGHNRRRSLTRSSNPARSDLTGFFFSPWQTPGRLGQRTLVWHCPVSVFCQSTLCPLSVATQELRSLSGHTPQLSTPERALPRGAGTTRRSLLLHPPPQSRSDLHFISVSGWG